jgi:hypothetical protein
MSKHKSLTFEQFVNEKLNAEPLTGKETLTDAQYALIYLIFKGKTAIHHLQQPYRSMEEKELRIMGGLSDQTVRHRKREMQILAGGEDQAKRGDEYYEEVLAKLQDKEDLNIPDLRRTAKLYLTFQELPIETVADLAMEAFTDENKEKGQHYYDKNIEKQSKYAQEAKQKLTNEKKAIIQYVSDITNGLVPRIPFAEARAKAIKNAVAKFGKTEAEITKILSGK